ncbi:MAG TPA: glycosylasparaginase, partial [Flavobacteriaceae bacterium]|nr:glycosylasparaginase [Flavobacteriaceae bacterium]
MNNRRNFIKNLGALGLLLGTTKLDLSAQTKSKRSTTSTKINKPIVLSTWRFGLEANAEAWKILGKNGTALNAVEQGVKLVEADPNERSVGYGGRPDRDG